MKPKQTAARKVSIFFFTYFNTYKYRESFIIHREYFIINTEDPSPVNGKRKNVFNLGKGWNGKYVKCNMIIQKCTIEEEYI